jgi:small ligand-binding sensory domain FIST
MKWASSIATTPILSDGIAAAADAIRGQLDGETPDLVLFFVTGHFQRNYPDVPELVHRYLPCNMLMGCSAGGVIGGGVEAENTAAISMTAAVLPGVDVTPIHSDTQELPDPDGPPELWRAWLGLAGDYPVHFIVMADPFSAVLEPFLTGLDYAFPGGAKVGGLASSGTGAGENALFQGHQLFRRGLVAVGLSGNIAVDTIVAQGCRPIGRPLTITKCSHNLLAEVDRKPPLKYLSELVEKLPEYDRQLMKNSLFLGIQMDPFATDPKRGEFLIRNLVGIDYNTGVLAIGAPLNQGQVVQFHLRDKVTSAEDLDNQLSRYAGDAAPPGIGGALLFSCVGRGRHLYGKPNHDSHAFLQKVARVPLGGFFCNGEIGPVGAATHIHGYTSSFGIFRPLSPGSDGAVE